MPVHYYEIYNCRPEARNGEPVLIAPPSANTVLLSERGFRETPEGEWIYTLTAADSAGKKCVNAARIFAAAGLNAFERTERRMHDVSVFRSQ